MTPIDCYCNSKKPYTDCCHNFLSGKLTPDTPEQLMRSRYSAFCVKDIEYLIATLHPSKRQANDREGLIKTAREIQWVGLKVLASGRSPDDQKAGYVEFAAFYKNNGIFQLHEKSSFIRENGKWYYVDGLLLDPVTFGRNDPCWCQSNKKYKKCHGNQTGAL